MLKAIDTETTGLYPFNGDKPFLITTHDGEKDEALYIGKDDLISIDTFLVGGENEAVFVGVNVSFSRKTGVSIPETKSCPIGRVLTTNVMLADRWAEGGMSRGFGPDAPIPQQ